MNIRDYTLCPYCGEMVKKGTHVDVYEGLEDKPVKMPEAGRPLNKEEERELMNYITVYVNNFSRTAIPKKPVEREYYEKELTVSLIKPIYGYALKVLKKQLTDKDVQNTHLNVLKLVRLYNVNRSKKLLFTFSSQGHNELIRDVSRLVINHINKMTMADPEGFTNRFQVVDSMRDITPENIYDLPDMRF